MRRRPFMFTALAIALAMAASLTTAPASAGPAIVPTRQPYPAGGTNAYGSGINAVNTSSQLAETLPANIKADWTAGSPLCPQAGGTSVPSIAVVGARTITLETQYGCSFVSAYNTQTGQLLWREKSPGGSDMRASKSLIYIAAYYNDSYMIDALDISTGKKKWSQPGGVAIDSIGAGLVTTGTFRYNATTGKPTDGSNNQSAFYPALAAGTRVYENTPSTVSATSPKTGDSIWYYEKKGLESARGDARPQLHDGRLYIRSDYENSTTKVFDPATGKVIRQLPESQAPIAFDGDYGFFTKTQNNKPSVISAVNLKTGVTVWSRTLPVKDSPRQVSPNAGPVVANGLIWVRHNSTTGTMPSIAAFDEVSGATRSTTSLTCEAGTQAALVIAQQRIFTSSDCGVRTYVAD